MFQFGDFISNSSKATGFLSIDLQKRQVYAYLVIQDARDHVGSQGVQFQKNPDSEFSVHLGTAWSTEE